MRSVARLLAILILAAAGSAGVQEKHLIDRTRPGSLNPEPLPPLQNPDAPSTPVKELCARKSTPFPGPPRSRCTQQQPAMPVIGYLTEVPNVAHLNAAFRPGMAKLGYRARENSGADSLSVRSHQPAAIEVMAKVARLN
jgi:hypothetical protein